MGGRKMGFSRRLGRGRGRGWRLRLWGRLWVSGGRGKDKGDRIEYRNEKNLEAWI